MVVICDKPYPVTSKYDSHFDVFGFPLSDFQKYAIEAVVEGHHVLVACPTGSGKTLPAEFAIQYFTGLGKKVIYTSPIKALSNQKYYEFTQKYPNISIGLMTGDIKVNPNADVLIMTTEILMNYLFNTLGNLSSTNSPLLQFKIDLENELGCVVFDEVHYINDQHRGQNWEQTILMLPRHVQMVMLSATIDSPERFANWCERGESSTGKKVYLAYTNHRIVPLTHYGFITTNESIFKGLKDKVLEKEIRDTTNRLIILQTARGEFNEPNISKIGKMMDVFKKRNVFLKRKSVLNNLTYYLKNNDMLPAIAFVFSRKNVESCAKEVDTILIEDDSKIPYIVRRECEQIIRRLPNFKEYLELPEYQSLVALLEKGIGIHHSGMIPVLREIVELFISKKYIKLLFATESFSIGLDCPIKTAVFTGLRKFDGLQDRFLLSHEYTQMAGRAGRRGIDTIGHVVHCNNLFKIPTANEYKTILSGKPQELVSKFNISYQVILNLMKQGAKTVEDFQNFVEKSMIQREIKTTLKERQTELDILRKRLYLKDTIIEGLQTTKCSLIKQYELENQLKEVNGNKRKSIERELQTNSQEPNSFFKDYAIYKEYLILKNEYENNLFNLEYVETFIQNQIIKIIEILEKRNYIKNDNLTIRKENIVSLDELGIIASNINEINGLIISFFIKKWDYFNEFSVQQIIGLLSCFTDIKVPDDLSLSLPKTNDRFLKEKIIEMSELFEEFSNIEKSNDMNTGIDYNKPLNYDVIDEVIEWCGIDNEKDCKFFIQNKLIEKEISVGDFTKAILKISVISKELICVCEMVGQIEFMHKLSQIDGMILKYITMCQSLYV